MWNRPLLWGLSLKHLTSGALVFSSVAYGIPAAYDARQYSKSDAYRKISANSAAIHEHQLMIRENPRMEDMLTSMIRQRELSSDNVCAYETDYTVVCTLHRNFLRVFPPALSP